MTTLPDLEPALEPFTTFARESVERTDSGWQWSSGLGRDRICDWFGPSDFGLLAHFAEALAARSTAPEAGKAVDETARDIIASTYIDGWCEPIGRLHALAILTHLEAAGYRVLTSVAPSGAEPVAWRVRMNEDGRVWYIYTERLPYTPDDHIKVLSEPEPLYASPQAVPAEDVATADLIERLNRAQADFWAHTRIDCLYEAANVIASLDRRLTASEAEATSLRRKLEEACEDITRGIDEEQRLQSRILRETERAEAAERKLEEAKKALEAARDGFIRVKRAASDRSERVAWRAENAILEAEVGADTISRTLSGASE